MSYNLIVNYSISTRQRVKDATGKSSALQLQTNRVIVGKPDGSQSEALLGVVDTPSAHHPHIQFGNPLATAGLPSATLTFAGWGIQHAGFVWTPGIPGVERGNFMLTFGGSDDPSENLPYVMFGSDGTFILKHLPDTPSEGQADLMIVAGGNVVPQTSSLRFKENVEPLTEDFQKILALQPKSFADKKTGCQGIGYVAEDLDELELNNLLGYDADGQPLTINYKLIPLYLVEVLKDQQRMIKELQVEVTELKLSRQQ